MIKRIASGRKRLLSVTGVVAALGLGGMASVVTAYANTGLVTATENCTSWSAAVYLNDNVTSDHTVDVTSTIPGTPNITNGHYTTTGGSVNVLIWNYSGAAPATGTVTLTIYNPNGTLDSSAKGGIAPASGCVNLTITKTTDEKYPRRRQPDTPLNLWHISHLSSHGPTRLRCRHSSAPARALKGTVTNALVLTLRADMSNSIKAPPRSNLSRSVARSAALYRQPGTRKKRWRPWAAVRYPRRDSPSVAP